MPIYPGKPTRRGNPRGDPRSPSVGGGILAAPVCRASCAPVGRGALTPPPGLVPHSRQGTRALPYKNIVCHPGRTESSAPTNHFVGADDPVAVPKISALPYGGRWKF